MADPNIIQSAGFHLGGGGGGGQRGALAPLGSLVPPLDFDFILPHSLVVDAAPP